jgi:hypothetical protein
VKAVGKLAAEWTGSAWQSESTLHQLAPYIGKTKSSMAAALVEEYSTRGSVVYDPFSGCGTFALEAWRAGRPVIANDMSPYARLLTSSKLFPYPSLEVALVDLADMAARVKRRRRTPDLRTVPTWVREFFHPDTLREALVWTDVLQANRRWFLLACLMGILHAVYHLKSNTHSCAASRGGRASSRSRSFCTCSAGDRGGRRVRIGTRFRPTAMRRSTLVRRVASMPSGTTPRT